MHNYKSKGQHFNYSFLFCLLFFPPHLKSLLHLADLQVIMAAFHTHRRAHICTESGSMLVLLEKPQYLGFSSSYLEFPLVCETGTFSLTDQQQ